MPNGNPAATPLGALVLLAALSGCGGAPSEPATPAPTDEAPAATSETEEADATLDILSPDPASVLLDGKPIGKTPITRRVVPPGSHEVTFVDPSLGNRTMVVAVQPGESTTVKADAPPKKVKMTAPEPSEPTE